MSEYKLDMFRLTDWIVVSWWFSDHDEVVWQYRIPVWNDIYSRDEFFQLTVLRLFHTAWAASAVRDKVNSDPSPLPAEAAPPAWAHPGLCAQTPRLYVRKLAMRLRCVVVWCLMLIPIMLITALSLEWENAAWCDDILQLKSNSSTNTFYASVLDVITGAQP